MGMFYNTNVGQRSLGKARKNPCFCFGEDKNCYFL